MNPSAPPPEAGLTRRAFVRRSCGLLAAAALASCGLPLAGCDSAGAEGGTTDDPGIDFDGDTLTVDLTQVSALGPVGGSLWLSDVDVLVVHAAADDYRAFDSVCPHRGNNIRQVIPSGDTYELRCPTHGWTFDLEGHPTGIAEIYTPRYPLTVDGQVLRITVF